MLIRQAETADATAILAIILPIIREGFTYALDSRISESDALSYWTGPDKETFVADDGSAIVGTYFIRPNQAGGGNHVCNCGYMVDCSQAGRGVAAMMCEHSLQYAQERGFRAMQFNFVVSSNERAIRLWSRMGFDIVGRLPQAFDHPERGFIDALVMHRTI